MSEDQLSPENNTQMIAQSDLYAFGLILDEISIAIEEIQTKIEILRKGQDSSVLREEVIMKILTDKGLINQEEIRQIYSDFKNANYGVTH
jgi:hypothetical protein